MMYSLDIHIYIQLPSYYIKDYGKLIIGCYVIPYYNRTTTHHIHILNPELKESTNRK